MVRERPHQRMGGEQFLQQREGHGADHRAAQVAEAAEDDHQQHLARVVPGQELGVHHAVARGDEKARQPGQRARDHEGRELVAVDRKARRAHALLVDADAGQRGAEARAADQRQEAVGERQRGQHEVELHAAVLHVERADGRPHVHVDAVAAAAERGVVEHEEGHLREGQRDHDEVDAARAQAERARHQRIAGGAAHGQRQQHGDGAAILAGAQHRGIGADAVESRMAQAHEAGHADQQLEAQREDREDHHLDHEVAEIGAQHRAEDCERDGAQQRKKVRKALHVRSCAPSSLQDARSARWPSARTPPCRSARRRRPCRRCRRSRPGAKRPAHP